MIDILKWPCAIISSQRTGSSALTAFLGQRYNTTFFIEPFEQKHKSEEFVGLYKIIGSKFIVKFMIDRVGHHRPYNELLHRDDVFKIRLYRKNIVAQVASLYLATYTSNWFRDQLHNTVDTGINYTVPIVTSDLTRCLKMVLRNNNTFVTKKYKYDLTVSYESLGILNENIWKRTFLPINYSDIICATQEMIVDQKLETDVTLN